MTSLLHDRRLGVQEGSTNAILDHPFFAETDLPSIFQKLTPATIKPVKRVTKLPPLQAAKKYTGEQQVFADF